jgi:hypothetical protein
MSRFIPKRGIGPALDEAAWRVRRQRVIAIRRKHWDRLGDTRHQRIDNALFEEMQKINAQIVTGAISL